jgi:hypothetical protein
MADVLGSFDAASTLSAEAAVRASFAGSATFSLLPERVSSSTSVSAWQISASDEALSLSRSRHLCRHDYGLSPCPVHRRYRTAAGRDGPPTSGFESVGFGPGDLTTGTRWPSFCAAVTGPGDRCPLSSILVEASRPTSLSRSHGRNYGAGLRSRVQWVVIPVAHRD